MRVTLVGEEESMEESEDEDLPEEGLMEENLRRDTSEEMSRQIEFRFLKRRFFIKGVTNTLG